MFKYHKLTSLFSRTLTDRIVLVNNSWVDHYSLIQQLEAKPERFLISKQIDSMQDLYFNFPSEKTNKIGTIFDDNSPTNFFPLVQKGVVVRKAYKNDVFDTKSQKYPDNVFDFSKAEFESRIFSYISKETYNKGLDAIDNLISTGDFGFNAAKLLDITEALEQLSNTCENPIAHQIAWAKNVHLFPDKYIPPLRVPQNFCVENLKPEIRELLKRSSLRMKKVSDYLYANKIPENDYSKALDLFHDSEMQRILSEN